MLVSFSKAADFTRLVERVKSIVKVDVLDKGYVQLEKYMTTEEDLIEILQLCKGKKFDFTDTDRLIQFLLRHEHSSVFEHIVFRFRVKCPIFVARQWFRHRIGSYTEMSFRVKRNNIEFYIPETSDGKAKYMFEGAAESALRYYNALLSLGVLPEQARAVLPLSTYTEFYWTVNMRSLMNFLNLRLDKSAQYEIRQYAEAILNITYPLFRRILVQQWQKVHGEGEEVPVANKL